MSISLAPDAAAISRLVFSAFTRLRAARTTVKPFLASAWAVALPIPSVAPVIKQTGIAITLSFHGSALGPSSRHVAPGCGSAHHLRSDCYGNSRACAFGSSQLFIERYESFPE